MKNTHYHEVDIWMSFIESKIHNCEDPKGCLEVQDFIQHDFAEKFRGKIPDKLFNNAMTNICDALEVKYQFTKTRLTKTKQEQYGEYTACGGSMTLEEWEMDGRYDPSIEIITN